MDVLADAFSFLMITLGIGAFLFCIGMLISDKIKNESVLWFVKLVFVFVWIIASCAAGLPK